ncbi:MAG: choline ABC transporter ATP-binding protein, partial [Roseinatronobacter sp.]
LKRTIIFVSHDLDEAFKLGNRIAILEGGRMIQLGTPSEIFSHPANQYVADFVANMNPLGVLRACDALSADAGPTPTRSIDSDAPIRVVMDQFDQQHDVLNVTRHGQSIGHVSRASVIAALAGRRGAQ